MEASKPKWVNPILNIIGVNSFWLRSLQLSSFFTVKKFPAGVIYRAHIESKQIFSTARLARDTNNSFFLFIWVGLELTEHCAPNHHDVHYMQIWFYPLSYTYLLSKILRLWRINDTPFLSLECLEIHLTCQKRHTHKRFGVLWPFTFTLVKKPQSLHEERLFYM